MRETTDVTLEVPLANKQRSPQTPRPITIEPYGNRFWAVYDDGGLVCVCLYKKGAKEVQARLTQHP